MSLAHRRERWPPWSILLRCERQRRGLYPLLQSMHQIPATFRNQLGAGRPGGWYVRDLVPVAARADGARRVSRANLRVRNPVVTWDRDLQ